MSEAENKILRMPELLVLAFGALTHGIDRHLLTGLLPAVASGLHVSPGVYGASTATFAAIFALTSPVLAALTQRWERRTLLASAMLLFIAGIVLQATAGRFDILLAGSVLIGLSGAMYLPAAYSIAGTHSLPDGRARALAMVLGGASFALILGVPLAILAGQHWGWRTSLWLLGAGALVSLLLIPTLPRLVVPSRTGGRWDILLNRQIPGILCITVAVMVPSFTTFTYLALILKATPGLIPLSMFALGVGGVAGACVAPMIINRTSAYMATLLSVGFVTVALAVLMLTPHHLLTVLIPLVIVGIFNAVIIVSQQHRLLFLVPATVATFAIGLDGAAVYVGNALGGAIGGVVTDKINVNAVLSASAGLGVVALMVAVFVRPERWSVSDAISPAS